MGAMHPQLVCPAGMGDEFYVSLLVVCSLYRIFRNGSLSAFPVYHLSRTVVLVCRQRQADETVAWNVCRAVKYSRVPFLHFAGGKLFVKPSQRLFVPCHNEQSAGVHIQSVGRHIVSVS